MTSLSSPPTPAGRIGLGIETRRLATRLSEEGNEGVETMDTTEIGIGFMDDEFTPMWWKDLAEHRSQRIWAVRDRERVHIYIYNAGMHTTILLGLKRGRERAIKEMKERLQMGGGALPLPTGYLALSDGIYVYLTKYRRATGRCPSDATWQQAWRGTVDSGGRVLTAAFSCSKCRMRRRVNVSALAEVLQIQKKKKDTCDALAGAKYGVFDDRVWAFLPLAAGMSRSPSQPSNMKTKEEYFSGDEGEHDEENEQGKTVGGFSHEAKQFYKAQGKHLQMPCYRGESSEVDLFAWKRGIEKYFETYGIVVEREKVTMAADTLEGEAAKWWNGLWMSNRDGGIKTWEQLMERLRERFLPPEGEMRIVGRWRQLQQKGSVASYADYVFRLKALCDMGPQAEFKLAFYGLQPELQAEIRKHLRLHRVSTLELEQLFAVALDAEVGLVGRGGRREGPHASMAGRNGKGKTEGAHGAEANTQNQGGRESARQGWNASRGDQQANSNAQGNGWNNYNRGGYYSRKYSNNAGGRSGNNDNQNNDRDDRNQSHQNQGGWKTGRWHERNGEKNEGRTCYVCDKEGHSWMSCHERKSGNGCACCGSEAHRLKNCPQRGGENRKVSHQTELSDPLAFMIETKGDGDCRSTSWS